MIGFQKQIERAETKTYSVKGQVTNVRMILVLSTQRFFPTNSCLSWQRFSVITVVRLNEISRNVSSYVSLKGPLVCLHEISIVSYVSTFTQFFSLLLSTFFHSLLRSYSISSLPMQRFSLRSVIRMTVLSSQHFFVPKYIPRFI